MPFLLLALIALLSPGPAAAEIAPVVIEGEKVKPVALPNPSPAGTGLLDIRQGGLDPALWRGSAAEILTPLLQRAGVALTTGELRAPALRGLARRLALTHAVPPGGPPEDGAEFFAARVLLAAASGDADAARRQARRAPGFIGETAYERLAGIALMQGDFDTACAPMAGGAASPFRAKLAAVCALRGKNGRAKARLALDVMREAGEPDTPFLNLAEAALGGKTVRPAARQVPALHAALLVLAKAAPSPEMLRLIEPVPYPLLLDLEGRDAFRGRIALALAQSRQVSPGKLEAFYAALNLKPGALAAIKRDPKNLMTRETVPAELAPAYALRAAGTAKDAKEKAALLAMLIRDTPPEDLAGSLGDLIFESAPAPAPSLAAEAPAFARLALLQGDAKAKAWLELAGGPHDLAALADIRRLLPERRRAAELVAFARDESIPVLRRADALALLEALGRTVPNDAVAALGVVTQPQAVQDRALAETLRKGQTGEALLRILLLAPGETTSVRLRQIRALRLLGFNEEALTLAVARL